MKVFALGTLLLATISTFAPGVSAQNDTLEELNLLVVNGMFTGIINQLSVLTDSQRASVFEAVPDAIRNVMDYLCNALEDMDQLNTCTTLWDAQKLKANKQVKGNPKETLGAEDGLGKPSGEKKKKKKPGVSKFGKKPGSKFVKNEKTSSKTKPSKFSKFQKKE